MSYELDRIEYKGLTIRIVNDECPDEPDWGDDEIFLVNCSARYRMGREKSEVEAPSAFLAWGEGPWGEYGSEIPNPPTQGGESEAYDLYEEWLTEHVKGYRVFPYKCGDAHGVGSFCFWLMDLDDLRRQAPDCWVYVKEPESDLEKLADPNRDPEQMRDGLVENYQTWANGDVWGFIIEDDSGEDLDESCWGFYGSDSCIEEAKSAVEYLVKQKRPVKVAVLLGEDSWEIKTLQVPRAVADSFVPTWAMENVFGAELDITGVALMSAFAPAPERSGTEKLACVPLEENA